MGDMQAGQARDTWGVSKKKRHVGSWAWQNGAEASGISLLVQRYRITYSSRTYLPPYYEALS